MFNRDHVLTAQYVTSPGHMDDVEIVGAGYHAPLYKYNASYDLIAGYADVDSGTLQNLFNVSGSGTIFGARLNYYLPKYGDYNHKLTLAQDYRAYQNRVLLAGVPFVPDITVKPTSLTYSGLWRMKDAETSFYATLAQNFISRGSDSRDIDFKASRFDATGGYRVWRVGLNYIEKLRYDLQFRGVFAGQYSDDALVSGEQFGFGGANSVRGFDEREVANDRGFLANLELYSPEFGDKLNWGDTMKARALLFYDAGYVRRNKQQLGEAPGASGGSVGTGVRFLIGKQFSLRADYAYVLNGAGLQERGDSRLHAAATYIFD
jgi:hemolysin activation/secretion protein